MTDNKEHQLFGEIMEQFEPYYANSHPFRVANLLFNWYYPEGGKKNPYLVKILAAEWFEYVKACLSVGDPAPVMPSTLEWAMMEMADLEVYAAARSSAPDKYPREVNKEVIGGSFKALTRATEWHDIFENIYRLLSVGASLSQAVRMVAVSHYKTTGEVRSAESISKEYGKRHRSKPSSPKYDPRGDGVEAKVLELAKAVNQTSEARARYQEDLDAFDEVCSKLKDEPATGKSKKRYNNLLDEIFGETA